MKIKKVETGDIIFNQDEPSDGKLYIVYSGEIALVVKDPDLITARNYERFESEQKKRTIVRLGSFNKDRDRARSYTPNIQTPRGEQSDLEQEGEPNDHVFQLLKSYMTSNVITHKRIRADEFIGKNEGLDIKIGVEKDLARVSGITRALVQFKKVLKQRNEVLNTAKAHGIVRDKLEVGQYFGGNMTLELKRREETAFALKDSELLVISYKDLQLIKASYSKKRIALRNFMFDSFPKLDLYQSEKVITGLLGTLEEKVFEANSQIITEGQSGEYFYIVQDGTCEISKEITIDEGHALDLMIPQSRSLLRVQPSTKKKIALTAISKGVFFGDELVFHAQKYCYSVKVISIKATVIAIKNKTFAARFPQVVFETLKGIYQTKCQHYLEIIKNLLASSQYENYELDSDLPPTNQTDKRSAFDKIQINDLWTPLKLHTKKKISTSLLYKAESNSARQTTSAFSRRPQSPPRKSSMPLAPISLGGEKDIKGAPLTELPISSARESKDVTLFDNKEKPVGKNGHRAKNRSMGPVINEKQGMAQVQVQAQGISQISDTGYESHRLYSSSAAHRKYEDLDKIKETFRARTAINSDIANLRLGGLQGKDYISYINSHRSSSRGLINIKNLEEAENKGFMSNRRETPTIDKLKLGIDIDRDSKRQFMIKKLQNQAKGNGDTPKSSARREEKEEEESKSPKEPLLPGIEEGTQKRSPFKKFHNRLTVDVNSGEKDMRVSPTSNPASAINTRPQNFKLAGHTLFRNQSFSLAKTPFGKEANVFDIETPKNINKYIAQKQHQKLKEKVFGGDLEESETSVYYNIPSLPRTPMAHSRRESSADAANKDMKPQTAECFARGGPASTRYKSFKPSGLSNFEKQAANQKQGNEDKKLEEFMMRKTSTGTVPWQNSQGMLLKQKGKMYKQLNKKGGVKAILPSPSEAGTQDFGNYFGSAKPIH